MGPEDLFRDEVLKELVRQLQPNVLAKRDNDFIAAILTKLKGQRKRIIQKGNVSTAERELIERVFSGAGSRMEQETVLRLWARSMMPIVNYAYISHNSTPVLQCLVRLVEPEYAHEWPKASSELLNAMLHNWYNGKYGALVVKCDPDLHNEEVKPPAMFLWLETFDPSAAAAMADTAVFDDEEDVDVPQTRKRKAPEVTPTPAPAAPAKAAPASAATPAATPTPTPAVKSEMPAAKRVAVSTQAVPAQPAAVPVPVPVAAPPVKPAEQRPSPQVLAMLQQIAGFFKKGQTQVCNLHALHEELDADPDVVLQAVRIMHHHEVIFLDESIGSIYVV